MQTKLLTLIFAILLGYGAWGQGAASIQQAWNKINSTPGVAPAPNEFWFILETDINADGDDWKTETGLTGPPSNPRPMGFNEINTIGPFGAGSTIRNTRDYYFDGVYEVDDGTGFPGCPPNPNDYEEWYIIKVPSTKYIIVSINLTAPNDPNLFRGKSLQWYEFDEGDSFNFAACAQNEPVPTIYKNIAQGTTSNTFKLTIPTTSVSKDYVAVRIGNNYYPPPFFPPGALAVQPFTSYTLSVHTTNNTCDRALQAPVFDGEDPTATAFISTTAKTELKPANDAIFGVDISGQSSPIFYGADDISITSDNGIWFRSEDINGIISSNMFAATCGSDMNPQLLVFNQCPEGAAGAYIGGENQNVDNQNPPAFPDYPADKDFNEDWNRDVCLEPSNNPNWPVIKFPYTSNTEFYFYLYGDGAKTNGIFSFYIFNDNFNDGDDILPVEWLDFTGQPLGNSNRLDWSTATETQNDYFVLEKSADGINYEILAQIPGQGDAIFQNDYSTLDESPYYQTYYRISQVDYDGTVNTGPQTVVINDSKKVYINLLANPVTNNEIKLRYRSNREQEVVFFLTGTDGKAVRSQSTTLIEGAAELSIPIPNLAPGMYLLSATLNNERWVEKVVVR